MSPEQLQQIAHIKNKRTSESSIDRTSTRIAVVGLGYVGLPLSILAASRGYRVVGFDIDPVKVAQLEKREANFLTEEENERFRGAKSLSVTADEKDLHGIDTFIICVPTPVSDNHVPDVGPLKGACEIVGRHLTEGALVVIESTVNPGVCEEVGLPALEKASRLSRNEFDLAHCPERINPGDKRFDVATITRVLGARTPEALERATQLYEDMLDAKVHRMGSIKEAEAVKMVENAFRDINIAFINELAISFDKAGIDIVNVIRGASTKPFGFMPFYPGCGVGGHCIPVDPYYLIRYGRQNGFEHTFLLAARRINSRMPRYAVQLLENALSAQGRPLAGASVALLGLAYKRDVPDTRESPALEIRAELEERGAKVKVFDPYVVSGSERSIEDALTGAHAALIATDHSQFCFLTPQFFEQYGLSVVVDGRNCLDKSLFEGSSIQYRGIGRGTL